MNNVMFQEIEKSNIEMLIRACKDLLDMVIWTSGSADFGLGGFARRGWVKMEPRIQAARDALAPFDEIDENDSAEIRQSPIECID